MLKDAYHTATLEVMKVKMWVTGYFLLLLRLGSDDINVIVNSAFTRIDNG